MSYELPIWAAICISFFIITGSFLTLLGSIGLFRFKTFYERLHMPTLATSWGVGGIIIASIIYFSLTKSRPIFHELLITVFLCATTPVTLMMLSRAAVHRDRSDDWRKLPPEIFDIYRADKDEAQKAKNGAIMPNSTKGKENKDEQKPFIEYTSS